MSVKGIEVKETVELQNYSQREPLLTVHQMATTNFFAGGDPKLQFIAIIRKAIQDPKNISPQDVWKVLDPKGAFLYQQETKRSAEEVKIELQPMHLDCLEVFLHFFPTFLTELSPSLAKLVNPRFHRLHELVTEEQLLKLQPSDAIKTVIGLLGMWPEEKVISVINKIKKHNKVLTMCLGFLEYNVPIPNDLLQQIINATTRENFPNDPVMQNYICGVLLNNGHELPEKLKDLLKDIDHKGIAGNGTTMVDLEKPYRRLAHLWFSSSTENKVMIDKGISWINRMFDDTLILGNDPRNARLQEIACRVLQRLLLISSKDFASKACGALLRLLNFQLTFIGLIKSVLVKAATEEKPVCPDLSARVVESLEEYLKNKAQDPAYKHGVKCAKEILHEIALKKIKQNISISDDSTKTTLMSETKQQLNIQDKNDQIKAVKKTPQFFKYYPVTAHREEIIFTSIVLELPFPEHLKLVLGRLEDVYNKQKTMFTVEHFMVFFTPVFQAASVHQTALMILLGERIQEKMKSKDQGIKKTSMELIAHLGIVEPELRNTLEKSWTHNCLMSGSQLPPGVVRLVLSY